MAIIVTEQPDSPDYQETMPQGEITSRTIKRTFIIIADSKDTGPATILNAVGIRRGQSYRYKNEFDSGALVRSITAKRDKKAPTKWTVIVTYKAVPPPGGGDEDDDSETPPTHFAIMQDVNWGSENTQEEAIKDKDGNAVVNSAGDKFDPPLAFTIPILVLNISRNEPRTGGQAFAASKITTYVNFVNDSAFWGFAQDKVLCTGISASPTEINGHKAWRVTYTFKIKESTWEFEPLEYGPSQVVGGVKKRCTDGKGYPISDRLSALGVQLTPADGDVFGGPFALFGDVDFNALDFDDTGAGV